MKKRLKKNLAYGMLMFVLSVCFCNGSYASSSRDMQYAGDNEVPKYFIVWDNNGGTVSFALQERPCVTVDIENATVRCTTTKEEVNFLMDDVHKYTLDANPGEDTAVDEISSDEGEFGSSDHSFYFRNYTPGTRVNIYTMNGMLFKSYEIAGDGTLAVNAAYWGEGVYLINVGKVTYKIIKK